MGNPDDIVGERLGPDLPGIRDWTERNFDFPGYVRASTRRSSPTVSACAASSVTARASGSAWSPSAAPASARICCAG